MLSQINWVVTKLSIKTGQLFIKLLLKLDSKSFQSNEEELFSIALDKENELNSFFYIKKEKYQFPTLTISSFGSCAIIGKGRTPVINKKIALPLLSTPNYKNKLIHLNFLDLVLLRNSKKALTEQKGSYILMVNRWSKNYHHWLCEFLPALVAMQQLAVSDIKPIIDEIPTKFQLETLRLLGFQPKNFERKTNISVERLCFVKNIRTIKKGWPYSVIEPTILATMRLTILKNIVQPNDDQDFDILWISRKNDGNRHVINEKDLFVACPFKIKVLYPNSTSTNDQIYYSSKAKIIAGPHGAGLSNAVWSKNACIIEVGPPAGINNSFKGLATSLNSEYYYHNASPTGFNLRKQRKNLQLDIPLFLHLIKSVATTETNN